MRLFDELIGIKHTARLMKPKQMLVLLLAGCAALHATAEPALTNPPPMTSAQPAQTRKTRVLTLEECIRLALEHNLDIQIQRFNPLVNQYNLSLSYGVYEPVFTFTASHLYQDPAGTTVLNSGTNNVASDVYEQNSYTPQIKGTLPTGMTYDLTGSWNRYADKTGIGSFGSPLWEATGPGPGISVSQPLLRNFWTDNNRLQIQLNKAVLKISEAALRLQIMTSITAVKSAYYNLLYTRGNIDANATAYKLAEQLVTENLKRVEVGALAPLDEKQSESQAAASLAAMQLAEQQSLVQENTLKSLLTDNFSEWADVSLLPAEQLVAVPQSLDLQESWRRAVTQRPEMVEAKLNIEKQNVTLKYDFNQIFPELDVTGSYGRNATDTSFSGTLDDISRGDHPYYSYGAFVSVPLGGNYSARNQYKSGKATLKQLLLTLKQTEQNIVIAVDNDVGNVRSTYQQVQATRDARIYAEDALAAEQKKLENGKSTSFIVLQLISNLTTAKVAEIQALANYNVAVAQLALDEGNTLEANHIDLKVK
jgi:outer membrane protein